LFSLRLTNTIITTLVSSGRPLLDVRILEPWPDEFNKDEIAENYPLFLAGYEPDIRSSLGVPLLQSDNVLSVLRFRSRANQSYQARHALFAQWIGDQFAGVIANSLLISEHQQVESALHEAEQKYRVLVENANDPIVLLQDGTIVYCNSAFETLIVYESEAIQDFDFVKDLPLIFKNIYWNTIVFGCWA